MRTKILAAALLVLLSACAAAPAPPAPSAPPPPVAQPARVTAKTAVTVLRAKADLGDRRLLAVSSEDAPRGFSSAWKIAMVSIAENEVTTYAVGEAGPVGEPTREAYNAVFDTQTPPFTEESWTLDSSDAARRLPDPARARIFYLEAEADGTLRWSMVLDDFSGVQIEAGKTPLDTPLPSFVPRQPARH